MFPYAKRIHVTGGAGSGKTRLAACLSRELDMPYHDLDGLGLAREAAAMDPKDVETLLAGLEDEAKAIASRETWITDGSYVTWVRPLFEKADVIAWLDVPWSVAGYRILARHLKAELRRNNRFPGWRRLLRFWQHSRRYYRDANPEGVNEYGNPRNRRDLAECLERHRHKLVVCRTRADVASLTARLLG